jgi:hypothetical protein
MSACPDWSMEGTCVQAEATPQPFRLGRRAVAPIVSSSLRLSGLGH